MRRTIVLLTLLLATVATVTTQQQTGRITRIEFQPATAEEGGGVFVSLLGSGSCSYTLDYGDGTIDRISGGLPLTRSHKYGNAGVYQLKAAAEPPCRGEAGLKVEISRSRFHGPRR